MGIISSIRSALGISGLSAPEKPHQVVVPHAPNPRRQIPLTPPPSAPQPNSQYQTPPNPIFLQTFPGHPDTIGPLPLSKEVISQNVQPFKPGHFSLGSIHESGGFIPKLIGRSFSDLSAELEKVIGSETHFMAHVDRDAQSAFHGECRLFHLLVKELGIKHPMRSRDEGWGCPLCGVFNPGP